MGRIEFRVLDWGFFGVGFGDCGERGGGRFCLRVVFLGC